MYKEAVDRRNFIKTVGAGTLAGVAGLVAPVKAKNFLEYANWAHLLSLWDSVAILIRRPFEV